MKSPTNRQDSGLLLLLSLWRTCPLPRCPPLPRRLLHLQASTLWSDPERKPSNLDLGGGIKAAQPLEGNKGRSKVTREETEGDGDKQEVVKDENGWSTRSFLGVTGKQRQKTKNPPERNRPIERAEESYRTTFSFFLKDKQKNFYSVVTKEQRNQREEKGHEKKQNSNGRSESLNATQEETAVDEMRERLKKKKKEMKVEV